MKKQTLFLMIMLTLGIWLSTSTAGEMSNQSALSSMAKIMHQLNHYPNDEEKKMLKDIIQHAPKDSHQRVLASAITNLEHSVAQQDAGKLKAIIADGSASEDERDLARIILNLNHSPNKQDKKRLESMMH